MSDIKEQFSEEVSLLRKYSYEFGSTKIHEDGDDTYDRMIKAQVALHNLFDAQQVEIQRLNAKCENMREAICIYSREMLGDMDFESDKHAVNYMLSFTEETPHGKALEECK